ncbi:molybdopterin containing oxidoreductase [Candidatus Poribacteria bacterium]|nr:MAG: molybdopterin containing oxidoreductase [Candidatus Poribacteria bacterium]
MMKQEHVSTNNFEATFSSRRHFLATIGKGAALAGLGIFGAGSDAAMRGLFGRGLVPAAWADVEQDLLPKPNMIVHSEQPFNGEFAPHLLNDDVTPTARHFVRNNSGIPERAKSGDLNGWKLTIDGEVHKKLSLSMDDLIRFPQVTMQVVVECAGNGRSLFTPKVDGTPWIRGAVGCSEWTGVRLRDVLKAAGLKEAAIYTGNYGEDLPIGSGEQFSRGIPIEKAMDDHTLIAFKMNGEDLPAAHGFPARLIVPGWIGSAMQKWLNRIWVRDQVHDSEKMTGYSYRVPAYPPAPGSKPPKNEMIITTSGKVKSLITKPQSKTPVKIGTPVKVGGHAWGGENKVDKVYISTDFGIRWQETRLIQPANRYAWYHWETEIIFGNRGYYEIWARAFDDKGEAQPFSQPWNPKGYLGNVIHRLPVLIAA